MDYLSLRNEVMDAGLLERQYWYYAFKIASTFVLLALSILILLKFDSFAVQLLNAAFLAFVFVQFGMLMHDAGHQQIFNSPWKNTAVGLLTGNLVTGMSSRSWSASHNRHHGSPNDLDEDPDVNIPLLAYSKEQALKTKGFSAFVMKYQAFYWLPLMAIAAFSVKVSHQGTAVKMLLKRQNISYYALEVSLMAFSTAVYFGLVFYALGIWKGVVFFLMNYILSGLYMGTVFATNHKGMPLINRAQRPDFLHVQVLTSRNVKKNVFIDFWTGGLNYQIEHHLFSTMPRNNLAKAQKIVRPFCNGIGVEYYETGFFRSYKEILANFHEISAVLRKPKTTASQAA